MHQNLPKILNINQRAKLVGGSDIYWYNLTKLLEEKGHVVTSFASRFSGQDEYPEIIDEQTRKLLPLSPSFDDPGVRDIIKYVYSVDAKRSVRRLLENSSIDLAHLHIYYGRLTASILGEIKKRDIPIVQTSHDYKLVCPTYLLMRNGQQCTSCTNGQFFNCMLNRCNRASLARSALSTVESYVSKWLGATKVSHIISVSEYQKNLLVRMGLNEEKITVVNNFVQIEGVLENNTNEINMVYIGRLEVYKGIYTLLNAMMYLKKQGIEIPLNIVGDGTELNNIKQYVAEKKLRLVNIVGAVDSDRVKEFLSDSIALIAPSHALETFGLTVVEAFASGRAVIASNIGGYSEIIRDEYNGILVQHGDAYELAEKIRYLYENPSIAYRMGQNGYQDAQKKYSKEVHYDRLLEVYRKVLYGRAN